MSIRFVASGEQKMPINLPICQKGKENKKLSNKRNGLSKGVSLTRILSPPHPWFFRPLNSFLDPCSPLVVDDRRGPQARVTLLPSLLPVLPIEGISGHEPGSAGRVWRFVDFNPTIPVAAFAPFKAAAAAAAT